MLTPLRGGNGEKKDLNRNKTLKVNSGAGKIFEDFLKTRKNIFKFDCVNYGPRKTKHAFSSLLTDYVNISV